MRLRFGCAPGADAAGIEWARAAERSGRARREAAGTRTREPAGRGPENPPGARSARTAIFARARFADRERPAVEHLSVEALDRLFGVRAIEKLDERESARTTGFAIDRQHDLRRRRDRAEVGTQIRFGRAVREITNEQTDGQSTLS